VTDVLTAWAAVAAAIFSLMTVVMTNQFARSTQDRQWHRETVRIVMTQFLDTTRSLMDAWGSQAFLLYTDSRKESSESAAPREGPASDFKQRITKGYKSIADLRDKARHNLAELELIASAPCVEAADALLETLTLEVGNALTRSDLGEQMNEFSLMAVKIRDLRHRYISNCRADLGAGRPAKLRSWWPDERLTARPFGRRGRASRRARASG
jgi:hypothetical protein